MRRILILVASFAAVAAQAEHAFEGRDLVAGARLYQENCAACHGAALEGQPNWQLRNDDGTLPAPPHDATGHTWHHDSALLFDYTKLGGAGALAQRGLSDFDSAMPAFEDVLSDAEIWDVLAYIQSTWPEEIQQVQAARTPGH